MLRIDKIMKVQNISTQELASRMQVTPQYVSEVANGRKNITLSGLAKFAKALHVPIASLLEGYHDKDYLEKTHLTAHIVGISFQLTKRTRHYPFRLIFSPTGLIRNELTIKLIKNVSH